MRSICVATMLLCLTGLCACASQETASGDGRAAATTPIAADPLSGTWTGDWGPSTDYRTIVTMDLAWDGAHLTGTLNPGQHALAITAGSFAAGTGTLTMEANGNSDDGKTTHYAVEGQLVDGVITGTWMDGDKKNDFKIKKS